MPEDALHPRAGHGVAARGGEGEDRAGAHHLSGRGLGLSRQHAHDAGRCRLPVPLRRPMGNEAAGRERLRSGGRRRHRDGARGAPRLQGAARRLGGEEVQRPHLHLRRPRGRGLRAPALPGPPAGGGGGGAVEHGAVARARADGRGRRARGGRLLGRGGEAARHPLAGSGTGREDEGGARRARRRASPGKRMSPSASSASSRPTRPRTGGPR